MALIHSILKVQSSCCCSSILILLFMNADRRQVIMNMNQCLLEEVSIEGVEKYCARPYVYLFVRLAATKWTMAG